MDQLEHVCDPGRFATVAGPGGGNREGERVLGRLLTQQRDRGRGRAEGGRLAESSAWRGLRGRRVRRRSARDGVDTWRFMGSGHGPRTLRYCGWRDGRGLGSG